MEYFRSSLTAHTLKDLEKALPKVSSVASIQVKDHVQSLVDESLVKVEKIGSGNWYWSFGDEEKLAREATLHSLEDEHARFGKAVSALQVEIANKEAASGTSEEVKERADLTEKVDELRTDVSKLREEVAGYGDMDPKALEVKREGAVRERERSERWTENCWTLESWLTGTLGVDREALEGLQKQCYGDEYAEGEGLRE